MNKTRKVILKYKHRPEVNEHNICAIVMEASKPLKQKHFSIGGKRDFDEAYKDALKAANALAKEFKVDFAAPSKEQLRSSLTEKRTPRRSGVIGPKVSPAMVSSTSQLLDKFGNALAFRAFINSAVKLHGVEKIEEVLRAGLEEITAAKEALMAERRIRSSANRKIAEAILSARDLGVDMEAPNDEVAHYISIILDERERSKNRKNSLGSNNIYKLGDERWDGKGTAPASIIKWLDEDENRTIDQLLVQ